MIPPLSLHQSAPWAITPEGFARLHGLTASGRPALPDGVRLESWREFCEKEANATNGAGIVSGTKILLQPVRGVIYAGAGPVLEYCWDLFDLDRITESVRAARDSASISALVLAIDSPGGYSRGVDEAARALADLNLGGKPVFAYIYGTGGSAAYWLAAASARIAAPTSAEVGSIGTYAVTVDSSQYFTQNGIKVTVHRDGDLKGMGVPGKEWTEKEKEWVDQRVAETSEDFKGFVRAQRPGISEGEMQGQCFRAKRASIGEGMMVDSVDYPTLGDFLTAVHQALP